MGEVENVGRVSTSAMAKAAGVGQFVALHPPSSIDAARKFLARAHLLVSLPWPGRDQVPAKIYEYADFAASMLVIAEPESTPAVRLIGSSAWVISQSDIDGMVACIAASYQRYLNHDIPSPVNSAGQLSREKESDVFADLLNSAAKLPQTSMSIN